MIGTVRRTDISGQAGRIAGRKALHPDEDTPADAFGRDALPVVDRSASEEPAREQNRLDRLIGKAERIARDVIRKNTHEVSVPGRKGTMTVLTAGSGHFEALWTRDACYGALGILAQGKASPEVRDSLQAILDRCSPEGVLPNRQGDLDNGWMIAASALRLPLPECRRLDHVEHSNILGAYQIDANGLPVIASLAYASMTGDLEFLRKNYGKLSRAVDWLERRARQGSAVLIVEKPQQDMIFQDGSGDWKDALRRSGVVTYTNAVFYKAVQCMAGIDRLMGNHEQAGRREKESEDIKAEFNRKLWDGERGHYRDSSGVRSFSPDGNVFAILFGLADGVQTDSILRKFEDMSDRQPLPFPASEEPYPAHYKPVWMKLSGMGDYHDRMVWTWQGSAFAVAAARAGKLDLAKETLARVAEMAVRDRTFFEVYTPGERPKPVNTLLYRSEPDFLWGAGMFLWAVKELKAAK